MIDAGRQLSLVKAGGLTPNQRIAPRHPRLGRAGFRAARWLSARVFAAAGFHQLGSAFAGKRIAHVREKLIRGDTVYLAGLGPPGTHNSGVALVEVSQATGPRLIVNNEEERFSGNKHTTEYPRQSIDAMVATLRGMGRDITDIDAWLMSWDYPTLAGTLVPARRIWLIKTRPTPGRPSNRPHNWIIRTANRKVLSRISGGVFPPRPEFESPFFKLVF